MYEPSSNLTQALQEDLQNELERYEREVPVKLFIDGVEIPLEETIDSTSEIDRTGGEIHIKRILGIKRIIQRHPEEFDEELHGYLFTDEEIINLSMSLKGAA